MTNKGIGEILEPTLYAVMSALEIILEDLKVLPKKQLEEAATYIHNLRTSSEKDKTNALDDLFGWMSPDEADEYEREIELSCERIDGKSY